MKKILFLTMVSLCAAAMAAGVQSRPGLGGAMTRQGPAKKNPAMPAPGMVTRDTNERERKTGGDFAFNYNATPLAILIEEYQEVTKRTVIPDPEAEKNLTQTITFQSLEGQKFTDEERKLTLEMLLEMRGIHLEPYGTKFVRAIPREKARKDGVPIVSDDADVTDGGRVISRFIKLKYVSYEEVQKALEGFKSDKGNFLAFERINTILVTDTELNVARMLEVVKAIDIETPVNEQVFVRQIKNASAQDIQQQLQKIVEESQKELQNAGKGVNNAQNQNQQHKPQRTLMRNAQPQAPAVTPQNLLANISDADRGMIRGKVLILADERSNKLIVVTSKTNMDFFDKVIEQLDIETTPDTVVRVYRLKYAEAEEVSDMINDLIGNAPSSKSSTKGNQNQTAKKGANANMTKNTTTPARTQSVNQRSGEAKAGEISKDNTTVLADKRINGLVVMTSKELVPVLEDIIESMDVKLSQVLIETCIIEVNLEDTIKTGVDWVKQVRGSSGNPQALSGGGGETANGSSLANVAVNGMLDSTGLPISQAIGSGLNYFLYNESLNLSAMIEMSKTDTRTKYIASPVVMTLDNKEANIEATDMRYMLTGFTSSGTSYSTIAVPNYEQKEIGITIKVTPKINPNGTVMLTVEEEYSKLGASQTIQTSSGVTSTAAGNETSSLIDVNVDTTTTRKMSADIQLEDGQTVILGGLTDTTVTKEETGIPILKDIPYIGRYLFGKTKDKEQRKELLVFMTPYVINDGDKAQAEARRRKNALSEARPWDDHGWSNSPLADPISAKEKVRRQSAEWEKQDEDRKAEIAIEKAKVERVKQLEKLSESEDAQWLKLRKRTEVEKSLRAAEAAERDRVSANLSRDRRMPERAAAEPVAPPAAEQVAQPAAEDEEK